MTLHEQNPLKLGVLSGLYPFLFYVSNNFYATNSWLHWGYFLLFFLGGASLAYSLIFLGFNLFKINKKYERHVLFISIIFVVAFFTSYASSLLIKKKLLLGILVLATLLSLKLFDSYKKLLYLLIALYILPVLTLGYKMYDLVKPKTWLEQPDDIEEAQFLETPNVYMLQPDGYVSQSVMESPLYNNHKTHLYDWLKDEGFTLYDNFRSNYPASLTSNASLFGMKHHYFDSALLPDIEFPYAREVISGNNPVRSIFKKNGYTTYFISEDEYFQQNRAPQLYDYFNIDVKTTKWFSKGETVVRDVYEDVVTALNVEAEDPKFFFIEKCLPHHVHFYAEGDRLKEELKEYLENVEEVNEWVENTITAIEEKDPNAIIIVLADHGGWVGNYNYADMFSTTDEKKIESIYSSLMAVKWNNYLPKGYDGDLKSNVNVFRVLFAALSKDETLLQHMQDNSSYNLYHKNMFFKGVTRVIDNEGQTIYEKL